MSKRKRSRNVRQIYQFIKNNDREYSVDMMCRLLGVARSGYYAWLLGALSATALAAG